MAYKTILACLNTIDSAEHLTRAACRLAAKFDAHLIGLHVIEPVEVYPAIAMELPRQTMMAVTEAREKQAAAIQEIFERETAKEDFPREWRLFEPESPLARTELPEHARCADLVIMSQVNPETDNGDEAALLRDVIQKSGRPVLVVPYVEAPLTFGQKALIGWSATREASRAAHDAMPFMQNGGEARILWASTSAKDQPYLEHATHELARCMSRQNIKATTVHWQNAEIAIGDVLLNDAFEHGCDMIVTGAFGHSRFYDFVIGATTSHLLEHMTVPVLFSH